MASLLWRGGTCAVKRHIHTHTQRGRSLVASETRPRHMEIIFPFATSVGDCVGVLRLSLRSASVAARTGLIILAVLVAGSASAAPTLNRSHPSALDGAGINPTGWSSHHGWRSQLLTTTMGHDTLILLIEPLGNISAILDSTGLEFIQRFSNSGLAEYYARATASLHSDNITVVGQGMPRGAMQVLAIHGASDQATFDQDPSAPASCVSNSCGDCSANYQSPGLCNVSMQTATTDLVVVAVAINDAASCGGGSGDGVQGFTTLVHSGQFTFSSIFEVDYRFSTLPGSNVVFDCTRTDAQAIVMDGISLSAES
ncbi:MAG TPA: hypothetical protein VNA15_01960 [Candidatus Angelobacter sp.]|nr:hypothetical protein [Candidatus Angelobacter sp.]